MKSNLFFSSLLSFTFFFISCKKEEEADKTASDDAPKEIIVPQIQPIPDQSNLQQVMPQNVAPTQTVTPIQTPVATKAGMNPPHGQPGHQCGTAVGASLNAASKNAQPKTGGAIATQIPTTVTTPSTQPSTPAILNTNGVSATGTNPPHGQPGHVCGTPAAAPAPVIK